MAKAQETSGGGISRLKLAIGAASLFLFIVGVKRSFRTEEGREIRQSDVYEPGEEGEREEQERKRSRVERVS